MKARPRDSSLRDAFVGILMTVGPFFGVRYRPPRVEIPVVTTPASETDSDARVHAHGSVDAGEAADDRGGRDGIVV